MIGIVLLVALAAIVDLRLLGVRLTNTPVSVLSSELTPWTTAGFVMVSFLSPLPLSSVTYHVSDLLLPPFLPPFCAVVASAVIYS